MKRSAGIGALSGAVIGWIVQFFFPQFLKFELFYNLLYLEQTRIPNYPPKASVFAVGFLFPIFTGIIGALIGILIFKLISKNSPRLPR